MTTASFSGGKSYLRVNFPIFYSPFLTARLSSNPARNTGTSASEFQFQQPVCGLRPLRAVTTTMHLKGTKTN